MEKTVQMYEGKAKKDELLDELKKRVPEYMVPNRIIKIPSMPYNSNGKIDRVWLKNNFKTIQ